MNKKKFWKILTAGVVFVLMISVAPELRLLGVLIQAVGLDMFLLLFEIQLVAVLLIFRDRLIAPAWGRMNAVLERMDPFYFRPSVAAVKKCPAIAMHSVPFLVVFYLIIFLGMPVYS